jgi:hypothetical protein
VHKNQTGDDNTAEGLKLRAAQTSVAKTQVKNDSDVGATGGGDPSKHQNLPPLLQHWNEPRQHEISQREEKTGCGIYPDEGSLAGGC